MLNHREPRCAQSSRAAPSPSSSRTSRARRACCTRSAPTRTPRRSRSTGASFGPRSPRTTASRSTRRATRSSSRSRPLPARSPPPRPGRRRSSPARSASGWDCTPARRPSPSEGYVGVDVHRGARVAALAHGGQVLVTEATATLVDGVALTDLGRHRLKDFDGPAQLLQLGTERHPPLRTPGTVLLPTPATRFLGRERELYDAVSLVLTEAPPILTIIGPGGTGKTRFSIELCPSARRGRRRRHGLRPARCAPRSDARAAGDRGGPRRGRRVAGGDRRTDRRAAHPPAPGQRRATAPGGGGDARVPRCAGPFAPARS